MYTPVITSRMNDAVRATRALAAARARHEQGLHLAEGEKLVAEAAAAGASIARLFVEEGYAAPPGAEAEAVYTVSRGVMEALCQSRTPQHVCAAVRTPDTGLPEAFPAGLIVVLDRVQDAGNVGTIVRTADAFGAAGVLLGAGSADPYSGKALRAAMGSTYHLPVWQGEAARRRVLLPVRASWRGAGAPGRLAAHGAGNRQRGPRRVRRRGGALRALAPADARPRRIAQRGGGRRADDLRTVRTHGRPVSGREERKANKV